MKRILSLLLFMGLSAHMYSQKSYVNVVAFFDGSNMQSKIYLSGDLPSGIESKYGSSTSIGTVLNMLSGKGFEVEFMTGMGGSSSSHRNVNYLLSKKSSSYSGVRSVQVDDAEATEVARYNLQGIPVSESERGVQIIVYSNYTTKTIIVE